MKEKKSLLIEKNVPRDVDEYTEAARKMEVGDSVLFADIKAANCLCRALEKAYGAGAFSMRTLDEGCRVWRDQRTPRSRTKRPTETANA